MLCANCSKLATMGMNKNCIRCQGAVYINLHVLCEGCSGKEKQCAICVKRIAPAGTSRGCGCGGGKK